jgi:hypothetical protein
MLRIRNKSSFVNLLLCWSPKDPGGLLPALRACGWCPAAARGRSSRSSVLPLEEKPVRSSGTLVIGRAYDIANVLPSELYGDVVPGQSQAMSVKGSNYRLSFAAGVCRLSVGCNSSPVIGWF